MGAEMGGVEGRMRGTVVRGQDIELVLASMPEQTWHYSVDVPSGVTADSTVEFHVEVPMRVRREIVGTVMGLVQGAS